ncbi:type I secretion system permease/ATPase [Pseudoruegeria sp. HB172150]|uniref:type I secretion system permease/ATPase n=1 Tax=Pseudoruegeria sp. HB172150 TaxID=2721164 RepID=UPI0020A65D84|nr:type I secretion system permease/ATPase [Pseudoruegeria sp. HB172150]
MNAYSKKIDAPIAGAGSPTPDRLILGKQMRVIPACPHKDGRDVVVDGKSVPLPKEVEATDARAAKGAGTRQSDTQEAARPAGGEQGSGRSSGENDGAQDSSKLGKLQLVPETGDARPKRNCTNNLAPDSELALWFKRKATAQRLEAEGIAREDSTGGDLAPEEAKRTETVSPAADNEAAGDTVAPAPNRARGPEPTPGSPSGAAGSMGQTIEARANEPLKRASSGGGGGGPKDPFHRRSDPERHERMMQSAKKAVSRNMIVVFVLTLATNLLVLAIPVYLFQISDRVLTSRSVDTLVMLTLLIVGAVILQSVFDAIRRFILMRTAVEVATRLGAPVLRAAAHASLHGTGREYQTLGDLQTVRGFLVSPTLLSFLDVPFAPLFVLAIYLIHPDLGVIVTVTAILLTVIALINQRATAGHFGEANVAQAKANQHLDSMSRNSQVINAMAMIPEAVRIWGKDTAASLSAQVRAQDRNVTFAAISRAVRLLTQVAILGWGAYLAIDGYLTGGMVIAASIISGRAFSPIEGSIEGWNNLILTRGALSRIRSLMRNTENKFEKLRLPNPEGRLDVERLLYVPGGTKQVVLNGISFSLSPGETLAVIGNSGAGKTTLGKMLVGSILPTSGSVRLDLMDIRNWDARQFGESIGYLPQDVQLFPGTIKDNIARMRDDATDEQIHAAAMLADVHNMIASLPYGYETTVAADGAPLSGGQKQRIALARAFYGNPRLVVLDEPNSNLDVAGDKALAKAIEHARQSGITIVVITQKPALLSVVDKIMLLTDGRVALFGMREQVLAKINGPKAPPVGNGKGTQEIGNA